MAAVVFAGAGLNAQELGSVDFPTSGSAAAQPKFIEGVKDLHSFGAESQSPSEQMDERTLRKLLLEDQPQLLEDESPSNEIAAGKGEVLLRVTAAESRKGSAFWLWMAADNLRLAARNAAACAVELLQLRPVSGVQ